MIALADKYPFLDPFAAKFSYKNGKVTFSGDVKKNFSQGVGEGLSMTIEGLAEQAALEEKELFGPLQKALDGVKGEYQALIDQYNFRTILPDLF